MLSPAMNALELLAEWKHQRDERLGMAIDDGREITAEEIAFAEDVADKWVSDYKKSLRVSPKATTV